MPRQGHRSWIGARSRIVADGHSRAPAIIGATPAQSGRRRQLEALDHRGTEARSKSQISINALCDLLCASVVQRLPSRPHTAAAEEFHSEAILRFARATAARPQPVPDQSHSRPHVAPNAIALHVMSRRLLLLSQLDVWTIDGEIRQRTPEFIA